MPSAVAGGHRGSGAAPADTAAAEEGAPPVLTLHEKVWLKKAEFEETIGIEVSEGAYAILENEGFPRRSPT